MISLLCLSVPATRRRRDRLGVWRREQQQLLDEPNVMVPDAGSTQPLHHSSVGTLFMFTRWHALLHARARFLPGHEV